MTERMGKTLRQPVVLEATGTLIAEKDETVTNAHLLGVQKAVSRRLEETEALLKERRDRDLERIKAQVEKVKGESDAGMAELRESTDDGSLGAWPTLSFQRGKRVLWQGEVVAEAGRGRFLPTLESRAVPLSA